MTKPLALFFQQNLLLGSQLVNRLQDLGYRVQVLTDVRKLIEESVHERPLVVVADLGSGPSEVCEMIRQLRAHPETQHLPVLAIAGQAGQGIVAEATAAGATLVAAERALLAQLPQLLDQVLAIE